MATTRKTSPKKTTATDLQGFDAFRARAQKIDGVNEGRRAITDDPFVLGEEYGFTPPIVIEVPKFSTKLAINKLGQQQDIAGLMRVLFGKDFGRFLRVIDEQGDDAELIAGGVIVSIFEHFYGPDILEAGFPTLSI